ncbi:YkgJ family cysteine cluster protein [Stratiformator vulcanicus]|uniref:Flagellin N-methylase n=1 Tax=Stratiformator vulcanicus TaxID=2527980 RepID=A0A517R490_9PLAN|nr:YkgJ family cysteine cluster protein [Stratiformator vulcanicus]QDT38698.1 Flagellin N-methylase [Stratiformator vulcanicus]
MSLPIDLPVLQNWSCHNCGGCCRQHLVEITAAEKDRIEKQRWADDTALGPGTPAVVPLSPRQKRWRLNQRPDGACVFLDENGLCRIHAKFGEAAKPLACRVYPYAFHPAGKNRVTVSLRYSCPSVVGNRGASAKESAQEIRKIGREVVPKKKQDYPAPRISAHESVGWEDVGRFVTALDATFDREQPVLHNLLTAVFWMSIVDQAKFEDVRGKRLEEFLDLIIAGAAAEVPDDLGEFDPPSRMGRLQFRIRLGYYARRDTAAMMATGLRGRWRLLSAALGLARGKGQLPMLRDDLPRVPFEALEQSFGPLPESTDALFARYFRTKITGMHFCGRAYYDRPLCEGLFSLALVFPITLYLARWIAAADGRSTLSDDDLAHALTIADHNHGYSEALGSTFATRQVRQLMTLGDLPKLCVWYAR